MEGKGSFFNIVLLFILAFLALTLAALAGYILTSGGGSSNKSAAPVVQAVDTRTPADAELKEFELYAEKSMFNLKSSDPTNVLIPIIQATASVEYIIKPPKTSSIPDPAIKLEAYKKKIQSLVGIYFQELTKEEANMPDAREKASKILTPKINDLLNLNEEKKAKIVYDVIFSYWFVT